MVAEHVGDCGLIRAPDDEIRARAATTGAASITKDEDFAVFRLLHDGPSIVWVRIGNTRRVELLLRFDAEFATIVEALGRGETIVELV